MKKMKLLVGFLLTLILALGLSVAVFAYDYEVTISAGSNGNVTFEGSEAPEMTATAVYKDKDKGFVTIGETDGYWGKPAQARYYFKGFHVSGQEDVIASGDITIEKDTVLVATYGLVGKMVNYTVNYQDASGATLYPTQTLIGNVGDTPVVAFRYVDGFRPRDLTLSQALDEDASKNVFTFVYDPAPQEVIVVPVGPAGPAAPAAPVAPGAGGGAGGGGNQPAGGGGEEIEPEPAPLGPGEDETIPDDDTPLGPGGESQPEPGPGPEPGKPGSALPWAIGGGAAVVIAAAIGVIVGVKKKKK